MPFFPEFLYRLGERDQQVTWLDPRFDVASLSIADVTAGTPAFVVPASHVFFLQAASVSADPGAGQNITDVNLQLLPPTGGPSLMIASDTTAKAANVNAAINFSGSILIPPGWQIRGTANFNAGAVNNLVTHNILGLLCPVANVQRV